MKPMNLKQAKDVMQAHLMTIAFSTARSDPEVVMAWNMINEVINREMAKKKKTLKEPGIARGAEFAAAGAGRSAADRRRKSRRGGLLGARTSARGGRA